MLTCERFAAGPYERGPVSMAFEYHNQFTAPENCKEGPDYDEASVLQWLYIDDPELGRYLREEMGIPTVIATFDERVASAGGTQEHRWALTVEGEESFFATYTFFPTQTHTPWLERLFWADGSELLVMDLEQDRYGDNIYGTTAVGRMMPPTLYGTWRAGEFYSVASVLRGLGLEANIQRFGDLQCSAPA